MDINNKIGNDDLSFIDKVSPDVISQAIGHLRKGKGDVDHNWKSEAFIHGIDALVTPLSFLFKSFLIHGHVSTFLLLCALVPIVKDKLGDKTSSSNYRAIAISSLLMKI